MLALDTNTINHYFRATQPSCRACKPRRPHSLRYPPSWPANCAAVCCVCHLKPLDRAWRPWTHCWPSCTRCLRCGMRPDRCGLACTPGRTGHAHWASRPADRGHGPAPWRDIGHPPHARVFTCGGAGFGRLALGLSTSQAPRTHACRRLRATTATAKPASTRAQVWGSGTAAAPMSPE